MTITIRDLPRVVSVTVVPGGAAGDHHVDGNIGTDAVLLSVRQVSDDLSANTDRTAEFSVSEDHHNVINNTGGTATTGDWLVVTYAKAEGA
jgi:hypothetical protein